MFTAFPTWIIVKVLLNFVSPKHEWYGKNFTLLDWYEHETDTTRFFDVVFWIQFFIILLLIVVILK